MSGHIFKNLYLCKSSIIFITIMGLLCSGVCIFATVFVSSSPSFDPQEYSILFPIVYFFLFFLSDISFTALFTCDERSSWVSFAASAPSAAKGQVLGKYYTLLLLNVWITFICFISDMIVSLIVPELNSLMALLFIFVIFMIYRSLSIPFCIRFGGNKGLAVGGVVAGMVIFTVIVYMLFGDLSFVDWDDPIGAILKWLSGEWFMVVLAVLPFLAAALYYLSYRVSLKIYPKGAENYGQ